MKRGIKNAAMLLCACMMLEMTCGAVFAKQPGNTSEPAAVVESQETEPAAALEPGVLAGDEAAEGQKAVGEVPETGAGAEEADSMETENDPEQESAAKEETEPETGEVAETEAETEAAPETDAIPEAEDSLETEGIGEMEETQEAEADPELEDAQEGDVSKQEGVPEKETLEAETAEEPVEQEDVSEPEKSAEIAQAGVATISGGDDYYVVWNGSDTLTFQKTRPSDGDWEEGRNYWGEEKTSSFLSTHNNDEWHGPEIKGKVKKVIFIDSIGLYGQFMFKDFTALESVTAEDDGAVTLDGKSPNGNGMFIGCTSLKEVNFPLSTEGDHAADLNSMFLGCTSLDNVNLTNWTVSNVTDFSLMFAQCSSLETLNLNGWNTSKAEDMHAMFAGCTSLKTTADTGIEDFQFDKLNSLSEFFEGCIAIENMDLSNWDTRHLKKTSLLFSDCPELRRITVGPNFKLKDTEGSSKQIHTDTTTGVWVKETDPTGKRWSDEALITMFENGNAAGTYVWKHTLTYNANGGKGTVPVDEGVHSFDDTVPLNDGSSLTKDKATFIGWSQDEAKDTVTTMAGEDGVLKEVTFGDHNITVYAVWAEDRNENGKADYTETKVKLTFNIGKGDGSGDPDHKTTFTVEALPKMDFDLPNYSVLHWSEKWEKGDGQPAEYSAVLAGWADHLIDDVILEDDVNDQAETHAHLSEQMIRQPHVVVPEGVKEITYYAVYAADENNDQIADYLEYAEQVEYYANGGTMVSGTWLDSIEGLFYRCGHHHVAGEEVTLLTVDRGKEMIKRTGAVLLGWSGKGTNLLTSEQEEKDAGITTTYMMPMEEENGKVYAVWASDANGNQIPDYEEENKSDAPNGGGKPTPPKPAPEPPAPPEVPDRNLSDLASPEEDLSSDTSDHISEQSTVEGWLRDAAGWRYRYADGSVAAGRWEWIKDKWYYLNADGYMATGWKQLSGVWYYLDEVNGDMKTGWQLIKGVWYHLDDVSGAMDTGWYLDPSSGKWYYLNGSGAMQIGWQLVSGTYYYLNESAKDGRPYGSMYANETTPDGYAVDASGAWIQ